MTCGVGVQAPTTVDELEARRRWEAANADSQDAAFHPAVPGPRFRAPDAAAAVARALPIVTAAYRSLHCQHLRVEMQLNLLAAYSPVV